MNWKSKGNKFTANDCYTLHFRKTMLIKDLF